VCGVCVCMVCCGVRCVCVWCVVVCGVCVWCVVVCGMCVVRGTRHCTRHTATAHTHTHTHTLHIISFFTMQKAIRCKSTSKAPDDGRMYPKYVELRIDKAVPLQACSRSEGSKKLRFPDFMTTAQDGGKFVSPTHRPPLPPGNAPGTHLC